MRPFPPTVSFSIDAKDILTSVEATYEVFSSPAGTVPEYVGAVGKNLMQFIAGEQTQVFWARIFGAVRRSHAPKLIRYRCDAPDLVRHMAVTVWPLDGESLLLTHAVDRVEPLPVHLRFATARTAEAVRCSICNNVRHQGVWRTPLAAWSEGFLLPQNLNAVIYDVCGDCRKQADADA